MYCGCRKVWEVTRKSHLTNRSCIRVLLSGSNARDVSLFRSLSLSLTSSFSSFLSFSLSLRTHAVMSTRMHTYSRADTSRRYILHVLQAGIMGSCASCGTWRPAWIRESLMPAYRAGYCVHRCIHSVEKTQVTQHTSASEDAQSPVSRGFPHATTSKALQKCVYGDKCVTIFRDKMRLTGRTIQFSTVQLAWRYTKRNGILQYRYTVCFGSIKIAI